ncbi:MAG: LemA family protein [Candidatus Caenarcaniphilales bacterium]|nr:LemA family protein [Candidatus Caenarcaniphilales bacterium]
MEILIVLGIFFLILFAIAAFFIGDYNNLVSLRNKVENAWSQIDVQLKRRHDLIPNLIETVKGYMNHERETLEAVIKARQQAVNISGDFANKAQIENMLSQTLKSLFAVSERYPDLKANQNFLSLKEELVSTENKISFARQFFNDTVLKLNNKVEMFPSNLIAKMFSFDKKEFFEIDEPKEREVPKVQF